MSYTFTTALGDGTTTVFPFSFAGQDTGYLSTSNVQVFVGGISAPFTINLTDPNKVQLSTPPAVGAEVLIRRIMPKSVPYSDFARGNPFSQDTLNNTNLQQLYVVQELLDGFLPIGFYFKQDVNMGGHKLINLGFGTMNGDSINYQQYVDLLHRLEAIETDVSGIASKTIPYYYIATGGETRWQVSGRTFDSAIVFINGVFQNQNLGAFSISSNGFNFPEALQKGDEVYALIGSTPATGSMINDQDIEVIQPYNGTVSRSQHDKNAELLSVADFGVIGLGDESVKFTTIENSVTGRYINMLGLTCIVSTKPSVNKYFNGYWSVSGVVTPADYVDCIRSGNTVIAIGKGAAPLGNSDDIIAIGQDAAAAMTAARNCIAIGKDAQRNNQFGRHNIAIGISSLMFVNGLSTSSIEGSRNIAIGGNSGRFMTTGNRNIILGRDAGHNMTTASLNICIGAATMMGDGPNTLNPGIIENQTPLTGVRNILIGTEAGKYVNGADMTFVGNQAGLNAKDVTGMVGIGASVFAGLQADKSYWGTQQLLVTKSCTYVQTTSNTITVTSAAHGLSTGYRVLMRFTTGAHADTTFMDDNWFLVTVIDVDNFTIQSPVVAAASGNSTISKVSTTIPYTAAVGECIGIGREVGNGLANYRSIGIGDRVGYAGLGVENVGIGALVFQSGAVMGAGNTAVGAYSQRNVVAGASGNVSVGVLTLTSLTTGTNNTAAGGQSLRLATTGSNNVGVGANSIRTLTTGVTNSALGVDSLRLSIAGGDMNFNNCTGLGFQSYVSGDNQVQIGGVGTSPYAYASLQTRSDASDKAFVRDTDLGIDFIMGLRPVRGKWNLRDSYYESYEVQVGVDEDAQPVFESRVRFDEAGYLDKTKVGTREHDWFIAQEVEELCKKLGVDFAGLHHAAVNGGCDVYSLGYTDFIPPMTKAIQQCWSRMDELEARVKELES